MGELEKLRSTVHDAVTVAKGPVLYRGESQNYPEVSSTLRRKCGQWRRQGQDLNKLQDVLTDIAKRHDNPDARKTRKPRRSEQFIHVWSGGYDPTQMSESQVELMCELQHWGADTNLIDFTRSLDVAIYFACEETWHRNGRIIVVQEHDWAAWRLDAKSPSHRVEAQQSVFIRPPDGLVTPWRQFQVEGRKKEAILEELSGLANPITTPTLYNDLQGYIRLSKRYVEGMDYYHAGVSWLVEYENQLDSGSDRQEMLERAIESLRKAAEHLHWIGGVWDRLALAYLHCNDRRRAARAIGKATRLGHPPPPPQVMRILREPADE
ncbi:MAG: FRG domain-containing protein [Acidobacteria bacterium]|nr:FRG domain-containing protein [Acidobacteriota bacterium]